MRQRFLSRAILGSLIFLSCCYIINAQTKPKFTITDLTSIAGGDYHSAYPQSINNNGQVAGSYTADSFRINPDGCEVCATHVTPFHAFVWSNASGFRDANFGSGARDFSSATSINNLG